MVLLNEIMIGIEFDRSCSYTYTDVSVPSGNPKRLGLSAISRTNLGDSNWQVNSGINVFEGLVVCCWNLVLQYTPMLWFPSSDDEVRIVLN